MLKILRDTLAKIVENIDTGNSNISEEEGQQIINLLSAIQSQYISKYQACQMLHISRSSFDGLVRSGQLPRGIKQSGFKELQWKKSDILEYINRRNNSEDK